MFSNPKEKGRYVESVLEAIGVCDSVKSVSLESYEIVLAVIQNDANETALKDIGDFYIKKNALGEGFTLRIKKTSVGLVEAWGQFDVKEMEKIETDHPLERELVRAVHAEDITQIETLLVRGANAIKRFYLGREVVDYGDFSRPQHLIPLEYYTHSPLMVAIQNQSVEIIDLLLESRPLTSLDATHLFQYAIDKLKMLSLAFLLHRKGYPCASDPKDDLIKYATSVRANDAVSLMTHERDNPGDCRINWTVIGGV
jgi:hypothetical protein